MQENCRKITRRAMILAAGRGERMRPLSDTCPKPLLRVRGYPLIVWHLIAMSQSGIELVVINTAWMEEKLIAEIGDGSHWGLRIIWSKEGASYGGALDVAGGIANALPWLGDIFWLISGDIFAPNFRFRDCYVNQFFNGNDLAWLWLVSNPVYHAQGDFAVSAQGLILPDEVNNGEKRWTWSSIALMRAGLFHNVKAGEIAPIAPLLSQAIRERRVVAKFCDDEQWCNVGTPAQLELLNRDIPK